VQEHTNRIKNGTNQSRTLIFRAMNFGTSVIATFPKNVVFLEMIKHSPPFGNANLIGAMTIEK
jgi:hypothetical protein